jgi:hypothetical protein
MLMIIIIITILRRIIMSIIELSTMMPTVRRKIHNYDGK